MSKPSVYEAILTGKDGDIRMQIGAEDHAEAKQAAEERASAGQLKVQSVKKA